MYCPEISCNPSLNLPLSTYFLNTEIFFPPLYMFCASNYVPKQGKYQGNRSVYEACFHWEMVLVFLLQFRLPYLIDEVWLVHVRLVSKSRVFWRKKNTRNTMEHFFFYCQFHFVHFILFLENGVDYWHSPKLGSRSVAFCALNKFVFWISSEVLNCHLWNWYIIFFPFKH